MVYIIPRIILFSWLRAIWILVGLLLVGAYISEILLFLENARKRSVFLDLQQRLNIGQYLLPVLKSYGSGDFSRISILLNPLILLCMQIILGLSGSLRILSSMNTQNILKWTVTLFEMNLSVMSFLYLKSLPSFSLLISSPKDFLGLDISS